MPLRLLLAFLLCGFYLPVCAHKASDSYLTLTVRAGKAVGQWDIALRDLDFALGLDGNDDRLITWQEVRGKQAQIEGYAFSHLQLLAGGGVCQTKPIRFLVDNHTDGAYSVLQFDWVCPAPLTELVVDYSLFFDLDPQHRGLLRLAYDGASHTAVFGPKQSRQSFKLGVEDKGGAFWQYLQEGVWHIWTGYDHILFLLSLLLPAVLYRQSGRWQVVQRFRPVLGEVVKIVTAFTVAHSITLSLATLGVISLPTRWVESAIAASVLLAALNNLYPVVKDKLWLVAFGFGLIHGLGFANVLMDLGLPQNQLLLALLAFNLGVELGQLAIVGGFLPLAFGLKSTPFYRIVVFTVGSVLIALLALVWLLERSLNLSLLN
ncbi:MAG: HupE/UreJ family protein [Methylococcales bacterium]|nr:HupE/UreJ family protein [Methylococcales bacterium]